MPLNFIDPNYVHPDACHIFVFEGSNTRPEEAPAWKDDDFWAFAKVRGLEHDRRMAQARKDLEELYPGDETNEAVARLYGWTNGWGGEANTIDAGAQVIDETGKLVSHPLAGKVAPVTPTNVRNRHPHLLTAALNYVSDKYATRSAAEAAEFPDGAA